MQTTDSMSNGFTLAILHALQQPSTQTYVPSSPQKDFEPFQSILYVDHEGETLCLPLDFSQVPMILSIIKRRHPMKHQKTFEKRSRRRRQQLAEN